MFWHKDKSAEYYPGYPKLPEPLRIGAIVAIEPGEALRYEGVSLALPIPAGDLVVEAVSGMELFGLNIYRAYVKKEDHQIVFQFNQKKDGALLDVNCFQVFQEIYPAAEKDWDTWLGQGGLIGGADLNAPNGAAYTREWGDGQYSAPPKASENIFTAADKPPVVVKHAMMLYSRDLTADLQEFMLLSADEEPGQSLVRCLAGVVMSPQTVKIY